MEVNNDKDEEEMMTELTGEIHSLFRSYVNGMYAHREKHYKLQEQLNEALKRIECVYPDIIDSFCMCGNCEFIRRCNNDN